MMLSSFRPISPASPFPLLLSSLLLHRRTFVDAKIKWVRDPYLDAHIAREKDLKPSLALARLILSSPSNSLPLATLSTLKSKLNLFTSALRFLHFYPSLFTLFLPSGAPASRVWVRVTEEMRELVEEETEIHVGDMEQAAVRLAKLLMLTGKGVVPVGIVDELGFDLGLPHCYVLELISRFPDYFRVREIESCGSNGNNADEPHVGGGDDLVTERFGLELVGWRKEWAVSAIRRRVLGEYDDVCAGRRRGVEIRFPLSYTPGFDLQKKVREWMEEWQCLPYISPYEDAFHLAPGCDQAEKWTVAVIHELLSLLVSKRMELRTLFRLGDYWGFGKSFRKALAHQPGIFYVSNKIRMQTVVLREAFRKDFLVDKHPLTGMRYRYIHLMSKSRKRTKLVKRMVAKRHSVWSAEGSEGTPGIASIEV